MLLFGEWIHDAESTTTGGVYSAVVGTKRKVFCLAMGYQMPVCSSCSPCTLTSVVLVPAFCSCCVYCCDGFVFFLWTLDVVVVVAISCRCCGCCCLLLLFAVVLVLVVVASVVLLNVLVLGVESLVKIQLLKHVIIRTDDSRILRQLLYDELLLNHPSCPPSPPPARRTNLSRD